MISRTSKRVVELASTVTLSMLIASIAQPGWAQVPLPGSGTSYQADDAPAPRKPSVLTGKVMTDIGAAEKQLAKGNFAEAEELFREILVSTPADQTAMVGLGTALAKQFKLDGADEMFDRVLARDPNNALAFAGKATVILNRLQSSNQTIRSNRESFLNQAETFAQQAVRLAPANGESHFVLGRVFQEKGNTETATSEFRTAIQLDPDHSYAYSALGDLMLKKGSLAEAETNFSQAVNLNSGNSGAHFGLGSTYLALGKVDDAIKELNTSLYQFPNSWPARMKLGEAYQKQGNEVAALKEYRQSIMIKPENPDPYMKIASIREGRGDLELALAELKSGLSQMPYNLDLRQHIADLNLKLEKADEAIKAYRTLLDMSPNDNQAVKGLSQALYVKAQKAAVGALLASNDYETALKDLSEAIKLRPDDMELRLAQAKLMSLAGTKPDISKLGEPQNDGEKLAYAEALMAQGEFKKASQYMADVVQDLNDPKQCFAVADVAVLMKDLDNAEAAFKKARQLSGNPDRVERGLDGIEKLRSSAKDDVKVANELSKKNQWDGAVDRFRHAVSVNPTLADARYGLANALERMKKPSSSDLNEAALQYENYLSLDPQLPEKDAKKLSEKIEKLKDKAAKQAQKENKL
ncbi:MAG: tetratricopeptide repeat protein [Cyanobacteria bacterium HKST-UBA02]|nr:tetratricopeptide repeat protein [Cyanobacteria bacterium HKST-UBA02]